MRKTIGSTLLAAALLVSAPASAFVIGFDDINDFSEGGIRSAHLASGYQGLDWSSRWLAIGSSLAVPHSGSNFAMSNGNSDLMISSESNFDFLSMWARGGSAGFSARATGYDDGVEVYTKIFRVTTTFQPFEFGFLDIDELRLTGFYVNLFVDDISVNTYLTNNVPEPSSIVLSGLGLLALSAARKNRLKKR
ncbi:PEP-CTERM sorting domain-containing protein [Denitromonas halophila]|uniref:PEP-CTERM sorting domain-containing protein n=1 Tax=Denitromonas halophila TaxID=1629404 RepID=UPI0016425FFA|nr:PEP-CTERM sorting domain-containing protein [Denitromonas halophila]